MFKIRSEAKSTRSTPAFCSSYHCIATTRTVHTKQVQLLSFHSNYEYSGAYGFACIPFTYVLPGYANYEHVIRSIDDLDIQAEIELSDNPHVARCRRSGLTIFLGQQETNTRDEGALGCSLLYEQHGWFIFLDCLCTKTNPWFQLLDPTRIPRHVLSQARQTGSPYG